VEEAGVLHQVAGRLLDGARCSGIQAVALGHQAHALGDLAAAASMEQLDELVFDP
jgi:hypothetical protein